MLQFKTMHFLTGEELTQSELQDLLSCAEFMKKNRAQERMDVLRGKTLALIFEKPSLRTRVSFSVGIQELGGDVIELASSQQKYEEPEDAIRVLQRMVHGVMVRTFEQRTLERMVSKAEIPVINGLSNTHHPCQALADLQTLQQRFGQLQGLTLAYLGDGNNVLHSLLLMAPFLGVNVHYCCPEGHQPEGGILARAQDRSEKGNAKITRFDSPAAAAENADALYTDVWTSMGFEAEKEDRAKKFDGFQINKELLKRAKSSAIVLHCLPMVKGEEITADVVELPQAALFDQAENRLHAQKALMLGLYNGRY